MAIKPRNQPAGNIVGQQQPDGQCGTGEQHVGDQVDAGGAVLFDQRVQTPKTHAAGDQRNQAGNLQKHRWAPRQVADSRGRVAERRIKKEEIEKEIEKKEQKGKAKSTKESKLDKKRK